MRQKIDKDIFIDFVAEVQSLRKELNLISQQIIETKMEESDLFEKYGNIIDRIYGTAATIGLMDFANYAKALKDVCYMCPKSDNMSGRKQVVKLLIEFLDFVDMACRSNKLNDQEQYQFNVQMKKSLSKVQTLSQKEFFGVRGKSY